MHKSQCRLGQKPQNRILSYEYKAMNRSQTTNEVAFQSLDTQNKHEALPQVMA